MQYTLFQFLTIAVELNFSCTLLSTNVYRGGAGTHNGWEGARCTPSLRFTHTLGRADLIALTGLVEEAKRYILKIIKRPEPKPSMDFKTMG